MFRCLTEPDLCAQWFEPDGASVTVDEMQLALGGRLHLTIGFPGTDFQVGIEGFYEVIDPPLSLVHAWRVDDEEIVTTVRFEPDRSAPRPVCGSITAASSTPSISNRTRADGTITSPSSPPSLRASRQRKEHEPARNADGRKVARLLDEGLEIETPTWAPLTVRA